VRLLFRSDRAREQTFAGKGPERGVANRSSLDAIDFGTRNFVKRPLDSVSRTAPLLHALYVLHWVPAVRTTNHADLLSIHVCDGDNDYAEAPYWINMGALAISTLAGARLILAAPTWSFLN